VASLRGSQWHSWAKSVEKQTGIHTGETLQLLRAEGIKSSQAYRGASIDMSEMRRELRRSARVPLQVVISQGVDEPLICEGQTVVVNHDGGTNLVYGSQEDFESLKAEITEEIKKTEDVLKQASTRTAFKRAFWG
jgi:hypothetical protein